jgi:hypothetical protein
MSKEGNMEELQRYRSGKGSMMRRSPLGEWVRFSDVEEREARFQARIEELEGIVSGKTMFDAAAVGEQRGAERVFAALSVHFAGHPDYDRVLAEFDEKGLTKEGAADSRSLLDSGEEQECPDCGGWGSIEYTNGALARCGRCSGSGRASTPSPALEECTNCDGTGTRFSEVAWDDLTCGRCNGNKAVPAGSQEGKFGGPGGRRPSPSGEESKRHCYRNPPCPEGECQFHDPGCTRKSGPDPVAVPEKVEGRLKAAEALADAVQGFYDAHSPNEPIPGGPSLGARGVMSAALAVVTGKGASDE